MSEEVVTPEVEVTEPVAAESDSVKRTRRRRKRYPVKAEEFVRTWQESNTLDEVVAKLKMPRNIAQARAASYRKKRPDGTPGLALKRFPRKERKLDTQKLTAYVSAGGNSEAEGVEA